MNLSDTVLITERGNQEIRDRIANLDVKARSVLLALITAPRTIGELLSNLPLERAEALLRIDGMLKDGLISRQRDGTSTIAQTSQKSAAMSAAGQLDLKAGVFVSEARFLLTDFCVDVFGTEADKLVSAVEDADGVTGLRRCLQEIATQLAKKDPKAIASLQRVVAAINETA